ncbi:FBD-associated F-box protein At1g61320 [Striga asiatica]|uniref:FBD-associated F-box protein At1g61320 n=1 Tax=Striga asiatica TaxID=4170 RepID=A0A5A7R8N0_STRAF|nr:FBD-associated F-box protein At1g61320 [Striga asiatica]
MADDVIETVLSYLPIKNLFGLAILSARYRYSLKFCRDLAFDRNFTRNLSKNEFKSIVNKFFENHLNSNAERFCLYFDPTNDTSLIVDWIRKAVGLRIKELELDFTQSRRNFMLSCDLINVSSIKITKLVCCELDNSSLGLNGLCNLRELTLQNVRARPIVIQSMFTNCLALRAVRFIHCNLTFNLQILARNSQSFNHLVVKYCFDVEYITLDAPTLCSLYYHGKICKFKIESELSQLNDLTSHIREGPKFDGNEYKEINFHLWQLKGFHLIVTPESYLNPSDVASFLKKCPYVERIFIEFGLNAFGQSIYWDMHGRDYLIECDTVFPLLKCVKLMMVKFFLKRGINLQYLVLVKARNFEFSRNFNSDCLNWGIMSGAKIAIYDYRKDMSILDPVHLKDVY